jgi:hypothetical protein
MIRLAAFLLAFCLPLAAFSQAVEKSPDAAKQPPFKSMSEVLKTVPEGVIPDRSEDWNTVKQKVVTEALTKHVGRSLQLEGAVWHIRTENDRSVLHVGPLEALGCHVTVAAFFGEADTLTLARLKLNDRVAVEGVLGDFKLRWRDKRLELEVRLDPATLTAAIKPAAEPAKPPLASLTELINVIDAGVVPGKDAADRWNTAKLRVANSQLAERAVGRRLSVKGVVHHVDADRNEFVVMLGIAPGDSFGIVLTSTFAAAEGVSVAKLKQGDQVTIEGLVQRADIVEQDKNSGGNRPTMTVRIDDSRVMP